jgi:hypothetical protein
MFWLGVLISLLLIAAKVYIKIENKRRLKALREELMVKRDKHFALLRIVTYLKIIGLNDHYTINAYLANYLLKTDPIAIEIERLESK